GGGLGAPRDQREGAADASGGRVDGVGGGSHASHHRHPVARRHRMCRSVAPCDTTLRIACHGVRRTPNFAPMTSQRRLTVLSVLSVVSLAMAGCSASADYAPDAGGASLTWGWNLPTSWDPDTSTAGWDTHAIGLVYDGLTQLDTEGE